VLSSFIIHSQLKVMPWINPSKNFFS
jgi:hypothetical protein